MRCPYCGADKDRVVDSRSAQNGEIIRRRRECTECSRRFTTYERIEEQPLRVLKRDGSTREDFSGEKLLTSLKRAIGKRQTIPQGTLESVVAEIERTIHNNKEAEITTQRIGDLVMERLRKLDPVAFIRFASVYRRFRDVGEFISEIDRFQDRVDGDPMPDMDGRQDTDVSIEGDDAHSDDLSDNQ